EADIDAYCTGPYDVINVAFANVFRNPKGLIDINLANHCTDTFGEFPSVLRCEAIGQKIRTCQSHGKKVLLSLGGGIASVGFLSLSDVQRFTNAVWNMFLGGTDAAYPRPFGKDVVLDGIDLDVEFGDAFGYDVFMREYRALVVGDGGRRYYTSAAPQCFFPDVLQTTAYAAGYFDWLNIQFYNNWCGHQNFPTSAWSDSVDFWTKWAKETSVNKDVRLLVGAPGSPTAAGSGYVPANTLQRVGEAWKADPQWADVFGGVMLWEVSLSAANHDYANAVRGFLGG
ncbi:Chitinase 1, partial [Borealophlyctis nickersoniae]